MATTSSVEVVTVDQAECTSVRRLAPLLLLLPPPLLLLAPPRDNPDRAAKCINWPSLWWSDAVKLRLRLIKSILLLVQLENSFRVALLRDSIKAAVRLTFVAGQGLKPANLSHFTDSMQKAGFTRKFHLFKILSTQAKSSTSLPEDKHSEDNNALVSYKGWKVGHVNYPNALCEGCNGEVSMMNFQFLRKNVTFTF